MTSVIQKTLTAFKKNALKETILKSNLSTTSSNNARIFNSASEAIQDLQSNTTILSGGFGLCGIPENLIEALSKRKDLKNLTLVSNNVGVDEFGLGLLLTGDQVSDVVVSYIGNNKALEKRYLEGGIRVHFVPQGTLVEKIRAAGAGIPFFYTATGYNTLVQKGGLPILYDKNKNVILKSVPKPTLEHNGHHYVLEQSIRGDFAFVKAYKADKSGNLIFRKSARNVNDPMSKAAKIVIAEVEEIVETGDLDPDQIHVPGVYIDRIIKGKFEKRIEILTTKQNMSSPKSSNGQVQSLKERIARRAALEVEDGMYVNLGVGIPTLIPNFLRPNVNVSFQSENGVMNMGPYPDEEEVDPDLINAGKETITVLPGASFFSSDESFAIIRGGHIDVTILGAMQVSQSGDLANWMVPNKLVKGFGGAADLAAANAWGTRVIAVMQHCDKNGKSKLVRECDIPLTGFKCVSKIITEKGAFDVTSESGLILTDIAQGLTLDNLRDCTNCDFHVSENLKTMS